MEHDDTYRTEHWLAWLLGIAAVAMGVLGALEGFALINIGDAIGTSGIDEAARGDSDPFQDGALFLVPSLVLGFLSFTLHRAEHHIARYQARSQRSVVDRPGTMGDDSDDRRREEGLWSTEHTGAYITTATAIALSVLGMLVGFNVFDDNHSFYDGMIWQLLSVLSAFMAGTLHSVSHHQPVYEYDDVRAQVEGRVLRTSPTQPGGQTQPGAERR